MKRVWIVIGLIQLFVVGSVQAAPVIWTISDAIFDDGGTLTGVFTFDKSTKLLTDVSITTSLASAFDGSGLPPALCEKGTGESWIRIP
jgi:hypothetical protein